MSEPGYCEGDTCGREGCEGVIKSHDVENCSCHINPPCGACTAPRGYCEACGWEESEDPAPEPEPISQKEKDFWKAQAEEWERARNAPLDTTKVSWRFAPHTNASMIKEGVYPEHMSREEVEREVRGTSRSTTWRAHDRHHVSACTRREVRGGHGQIHWSALGRIPRKQASTGGHDVWLDEENAH